MKTTTIGIDLAKTVFQIHGVDDHGKPVMRRGLSKMLITLYGLVIVRPLPIGLFAIRPRTS